MLEGSESYPELMNIRNAEVEENDPTLSRDMESAGNERVWIHVRALAKHMNREIRGKRKRRVMELFRHDDYWISYIYFLDVADVQATFPSGAYPMEWIENGVAWLSSIGNYMPSGPLRSIDRWYSPEGRRVIVFYLTF